MEEENIKCFNICNHFQPGATIQKYFRLITTSNDFKILTKYDCVVVKGGTLLDTPNLTRKLF